MPGKLKIVWRAGRSVKDLNTLPAEHKGKARVQELFLLMRPSHSGFGPAKLSCASFPALIGAVHERRDLQLNQQGRKAK